MKITIEMDIDFGLLRQQKQQLSDLDETNEAVEGMLVLIDHIQDFAVDSGQASEAEVFDGDDEEEEEEPHPRDMSYLERVSRKYDYEQNLDKEE